MTLAEINKSLGATGTDKGDLAHTHANRSNLDIYEPLFAHLRDTAFDLIEIGVRNGGSMRLWTAAFPNARIHGIDIDPACAGCVSNRVTVTIGSQDDPAVLSAVLATCPNLCVVIDDGAHYLPFMLASHALLWPALKPRGLYIFEDAAITRQGIDAGWPGMSCNTKPMPPVPRAPLDQLILNTILDMDLRRGDVASFRASYNLLILEKI
jgi:hypothetical protein